MKLVGPLRGLILGNMVQIYRSAALSLPIDNVGTWQQFLIEFFSNEIANLDMSYQSLSSFPSVYPYPKFFSDFFRVFYDKINEWLNQNGATADNELIEVIEALKIDPFMVQCIGMESSMSFVPPNFPANFSMVKSFKFSHSAAQRFCILLSKLVDLIEEKTESKIGLFEKEYWRNACFAVGYARRADA
jgi:hypothetical protein